MLTWFRTPAQRFAIALLIFLTTAFGGLLAYSFGRGQEVVNRLYPESIFEREEIKPEQAPSFTLTKRSLCELEVHGVTLNQSWVWVRAVIVDAQNRPVYTYSFNLSHYHGREGGESWSEGKDKDEKVFLLGPGTYKVLIYGEDAKVSDRPTRARGYYTIERDERLRLTVKRDVWLSRYFAILFGLFATLTLIYAILRSERSKTEASWESGTFGTGAPPNTGGFDVDYGAGTSQAPSSLPGAGMDPHDYSNTKQGKGW